MDRKLEIAQIVVGLAEYYDKQLSPAQVSMYVADLSEFEPQILLEAVVRYRNDPQNERFPLPGRLKSMINPALDPQAEAVEVANRIYQAICRVSPDDPEKARRQVGELGWLVVEREGGWKCLSTSITNNDQVGTRKAQWREMAKAQFARARYGATGAPQLPSVEKAMPLTFDPTKLLPEMPK